MPEVEFSLFFKHAKHLLLQSIIFSLIAASDLTQVWLLKFSESYARSQTQGFRSFFDRKYLI